MNWTIRLDKDELLDAQNRMGEEHSESCELYVHSTTPKASQRNTVLHEAIHAIDDSCFAGTPFALTELQVKILANELCELVRDNPELMQFIMEAD